MSLLRPLVQKVPRSKPDSTKNQPYMWTWCKPNLRCGHTSTAEVVRKLGKCVPTCHLTTAQNCEISPELALVLLQNGR
ncbi:hypothetical protein AVEN_69994-1 [Araneus ventricosus]|uniref:Uncharacterized protein n=1 Tax=Araneus ventricosus TaxID=182803 RepID=A0A4Y2KN10_ARAVE|nr:hypothetical protein AVEN_69994-1 [Araneus ventricosus]